LEAITTSEIRNVHVFRNTKQPKIRPQGQARIAQS